MNSDPKPGTNGKPDPTEKIEFPCNYPIKVMVRAEPGARDEIDAIVGQHAVLDPSSIAERLSAQNNFIGLTYVIRATGQRQIEQLFQALKRSPRVLLVL